MWFIQRLPERTSHLHPSRGDSGPTAVLLGSWAEGIGEYSKILYYISTFCTPHLRDRRDLNHLSCCTRLNRRGNCRRTPPAKWWSLRMLSYLALDCEQIHRGSFTGTPPHRWAHVGVLPALPLLAIDCVPTESCAHPHPKLVRSMIMRSDMDNVMVSEWSIRIPTL